jgi:glutamate synthase (NADPH/NADH) small chain
MDYLRGSTSYLLSQSGEPINAAGKDVVVIGGGDTGTDCIGTSIRQGCRSVTNLEIVNRPPDARADSNPWPQWPLIFRTDYGHAEAAAKFGNDPRQFATETIEFIGDADWNLTGLKVGKLVFLALGFVGPEQAIADAFGLETDPRSNILANEDDHETSKQGIFTAGDCRRGQSLVVWAIREGRNAADACHQFLTAAVPV